MKWNAYLRLMRLNKPAGILLLWFPTAWALWLANPGMPSLTLIILFSLGTIIMRSAGCVINDIADREIDKHVARTKLRPIACGEVTLKDALVVFLVLIGSALLIALNLPFNCFYWAVGALLITLIYPLCKRFFKAPQLILGIAFSMGIPMAYVASAVALNEEFIFLCVINFCWIVAYDTMYAMTDKADDLKIGVKYTAIYFADYDRLIIGLLQFTLHASWFYWGCINHATWLFFLLWFISGLVLIFQQFLIRNYKPEDCYKAFNISIYYGFLMWFALILA